MSKHSSLKKPQAQNRRAGGGHVKRVIIKPMLQILPSAKPFVTDRVQILLDKLSHLLTQAARRYGIPAERIVVSGYVDPEEDFKQVVITQFVNLPAEEALAYWNKLGLLIADWEKALPDSFTPVMENIAVEVDWNVRTSAVQSA